MKQIFLLSIFVLLLHLNTYANKLVLGFNTDEFAPFTYYEDGKAAGPVVDIVNYTCKKLDINCVHEVLPWRRAVQEIKDGKADGLYVVGKNKSRESWLHFSHPIITTQYGFFVLKSNNKVYKSIKDIEGYKVGVFGPSNTNSSLDKINEQLKSENNQPLDIRVLDEDLHVFLQLNSQNRGLQAVYSNIDVGFYFIRKYKLENIKYMGKNKELDYYISFSKKTVSEDLVKKFNGVIKNMHQNKELQKILDRYFLKSAYLK